MTRRTREKRDGMVLIVVVVVVVMISLAGLSFVATMSMENKAARAQGDELQLEHLAGSGVEYLAAFVQQSWTQQQEAGGAWDNPGRFRGVLVFEGEEGGRRAQFSVVAPRIENGESRGIRFGVEDESARLNLAVLLEWDARQPGAAHEALMNLPGMTDAIADAILDWIDPDSDPRPAGAEADDYQALAVPYAPRNGVPQCLEELLLVRGVTRDLLFGADANFNHQVEPAEQRAAAGRLEGTGLARGLPWASLLTVSSAERNQSADGRPRIELNQGDLAVLHRQLQEALEPRWADFIVLYRQFGPAEGPEPPGEEKSPGKAGKEEAVTVNPSTPAKFRIESIFDLVDARVEVPVPGQEEPRIVAGPFPSEPAQMREYLPRLLERTSVVDGAVIFGRINVNLAPREVLRAAPGMDTAAVEQILTARASRPMPEDPNRRHAAWLLTEGVLSVGQMKDLMPYLTGGGDVVRAQVIAMFDPPGPSLRVETVIDATASPARQVYWKDLRLLGRGYPLESLGAEFSAPQVRGLRSSGGRVPF